MKLAHVIPSVAARDGGPSTSVVSMCQALASCGVDVTLVTTDADGPHRLPVALGRITDWCGVPTIFFERQWTESFKYSGPLASWIDTHASSFELMHVHGVLSHAPLAAAGACRRSDVPYLVRPLGTLDPWSLAQRRLKKQILLSAVGMRMLRGASAIHCTSDEERRAVNERLKTHTAITVPLGVDDVFLRREDSSEGDRDRTVLVVSRLHPVKNLDTLIEAFADAVAEFEGQNASSRDERGWRLIIAGSGDARYEERLRSVVRARQLEPRVEFTGWVDRESKVRLMHKASLYALPSLHENFGVSLVEALASGLPALVTTEVHLSDVVREARAGWVVGIDRASIRDGLLRVWRDPVQRAESSQAARTLATRFSWSAVALELTTLYSTLTSQTNVHAHRQSAAQRVSGLSA